MSGLKPPADAATWGETRLPCGRPSGPDATPPNHTFLHSEFGMEKRGLGDSVLQDHVHRIERVGTTQIVRDENRSDQVI
jgi:hypothetical protein